MDVGGEELNSEGVKAGPGGDLGGRFVRLGKFGLLE